MENEKPYLGLLIGNTLLLIIVFTITAHIFNVIDNINNQNIESCMIINDLEYCRKED